MPLKNQPYLPLYVQDVLTDEALIECSAETQGVYFRLLCVLHKQTNYGKFLLKQKYKQNDSIIANFAKSLVRPLALDLDVIWSGLNELIEEKVLSIEGDFIVQKRMVKDAELSDKRSAAGKKGGNKSSKSNKDFAQAKSEANSDIEIEIEDVTDSKKSNGEKYKNRPSVVEEVEQFFMELTDGDLEFSKNQAKAFYNFYESKGWKVGKNPMKNWRAAARGQWMKDYELVKPKSRTDYSSVKSAV